MSSRTLYGAALCYTILSWPSTLAFAAPPPPPSIEVKEQIGSTLPLDASFTNHLGESLKLGSFFDGTSPVILTMNYYRCETLCDITLRKLAGTIERSGWANKNDYKIVTVGIHPEETHEHAAAKRMDLGLEGEDDIKNWSFLVGKKEAIDAVAKSTGFGLHYDKETDQWAHPAAVVLVSSKGEIKAYRYGVVFTPNELRFSLIGTKDWSLGDIPERLLISCYRYDDIQGKYVPYAWGIMRLAASIFLIIFVSFLVSLRRRENHAPREVA